MVEWHEDDRFWEMRSELMFGAGRLAKTPAEVDQMLALLDATAPAKVLDLCCGPGRHSVDLAKRGFAVTGVDRTKPYLARAKAAASEAGADVEFVEGDMRAFRREGAFDFAINMFTSFGYFADPEDDRKVAANLCNSLKPGGKLLMDLMGREVLARKFQARSWDEAGGVLLLADRHVEQDWTWMKCREIYIRGTERWETMLEHRLYSASELARLLREEGFAEVRTFGNLDGAPYDQDAGRLIVVAQK